MMEIQSKKRDKGIELIKIIATIAVVMIHGKNIYGYASVNLEKNYLVNTVAFIMSTGVPLFFIASGYLWGKKISRNPVNRNDEFLKTWKTLVIPYVIVNGMWLCFEIILSLTMKKYSEIASFSFLNCISYISWRPIYAPFWFIRNLIALRVISILLESINAKLAKYVYIVMVVTGLLIPLPIDNYGRVTLIYYGIGVLIGSGYEQIAKVDRETSVKTCVIYLSLVVVCLFGIHYTNNAIALRILSLLQTMLETAFFLSLGRREYNDTRCLALIGANSFFIYAFHGKLLSILQIIATKVFPQTQVILFLEYIGFPALIITVLIFTSMVMKRFFPFCYKLVTGGR